MAIVEVKVPAVGESVQEAEIADWQKADGDQVALDDVLLELETDKASMEILAEAAGTLSIVVQAGETVKVGDVLGRIDTSAAASAATSSESSTGAAPNQTQAQPEQAKPTPPASDSASAPLAAANHSKPLSPAVQRMVSEHKLDPNQMSGTGRDGRITKTDVLAFQANTPATGNPSADNPATQGTASTQPSPGQAKQTTQAASSPSAPPPGTSVGGGHGAGAERLETRKNMSLMRRRIAQRLVEAQQTSALLTTFNEVDMSALKALRGKYKESFKEKYGVGLGFMSFFVKASIEALKAFPSINGWVEGNEVVSHNYYDVGVAVSTGKGLVVPVLRDADRLTPAQIEQAIAHYAKRARDGKISVDEITGGNFTLSNGGVFGSLLSTPIVNPPQSAILGMHKIQDRPMAENGQVVIRPMMYLALTYDHRIVDGKEAVQFLVKIKDCIEDPARLLLEI